MTPPAPKCARCKDEGVVSIANEFGLAVLGACPDCDAGKRLYRVLVAIARGEPIALHDTFASGYRIKEFVASGVIGPATVESYNPAHDLRPKRTS